MWLEHRRISSKLRNKSLKTRITRSSIKARWQVKTIESKTVISVFASLQILEKSLDRVRARLPRNPADRCEAANLFPQMERIVIEMRRTANKLQIQLAKKQWLDANRSLQIFYGLHKMVKSDIAATHQLLIDYTHPSTRIIKAEKKQRELTKH